MADNTFEGWSKIQINNIILTSLVTKKAIDISHAVQGFEVYKSIFHPTMSGNIVIADGSGVLQKLPMLGEEALIIDMQSPTRTAFKKLFYIHEIADQDYDPNGSLIRYSLNFHSSDQYNALTTGFSQGFNDNVSNIVKNILTKQVKTTQAIEVEDTKGTEKIVIPYGNVWEGLELLRQRAVSTQYQSPYVFYEDSKGYHFVSYEYLIKKNQGNANNYTYTADSYLPGAGEGPGSKTVLPGQYFNAFDFQYPTKASTADLINRGGLNSQVLVFDILNKSCNTVTAFYNDANSIIKVPFEGTFNPNHSQGFANNAGLPPIEYLIPYDSTNPMSIPNNYSKRVLFSAMLEETKVSFNTNIDTSLEPGIIIQLNVPARYTNQKWDPALTGQYIVGGIRHGVYSEQGVSTLDCFRFGAATKVFQ